MDEFELIERYFAAAAAANGVNVPIGDDAAIVSPTANHKLVVAADTLVEGVHYPSEFSAEDLGFRCVAVNLSDMAAMGATPRWMTLALTLPSVDPDWMEGFAAGLHVAAEAHQVALIGGDTTRGTETVIAIQMLGEVPAGRGLLRSGAAVGDAIFVSGTLGDAAAGLDVLLSGQAPAGQVQIAGALHGQAKNTEITSGQAVSGQSLAGEQRELVNRFSRPRARVALGKRLLGLATSAIDISDGFASDLAKLLAASGVGGEIDLGCLPVSAALKATVPSGLALQLALSGGDDYELCFTVSVDKVLEIQELARELGLSLTQVGEVKEGAGLKAFDAGGVELPLQLAGYRHFTNTDDMQGGNSGCL